MFTNYVSCRINELLLLLLLFLGELTTRKVAIGFDIGSPATSLNKNYIKMHSVFIKD
jgi:hypothetical protein